MNKHLNKMFSVITILALMLMALPAQSTSAAGTISLTVLGSPYSQNFDTLANTGTSSTVPTGWDFLESGTNANVTYTAGTGSSTTGDTYSFGSISSSERAFGGLLSGSLNPTIGAQFTNDTGSAITSLAVSYTGEMWRAGVTNRNAADRIDFQLSTNATSLTSGTWADYDSLDFNSPNINTTAGLLDGNLAGNRTTLSFTITGISIANGSSFWIRWTDFNIASSDDGLSVDDFSLTPDFVVTPTNPSGVGAANPSTVSAGSSTLLTVSVTPGTNPTSTGLAVTGDLTTIGGSAGQPFFDDASNGDATAGDNVFSFLATVAAGTTAGAKTLPISITDAQSRSGSTSIALTVIEIIPIGTVQGSVGNADNGLTHRSPYAPATGNSAGSTTVTVQAVIYEKTLARTSTGGSQNGIFIQNTAATADSDPNSSDGIFVFMGNFTTLLRAGGGTYTPQVGDEIILSGRVSEFFFLSQLSSSLSVIQVVRSGVDLNAEVPAFDVNPPDVLADANRYWERHEGMRAQVPANSIVIDSRDVFASTADGEMWLARGDHPIAQRADPYARRAFRDAHPLDDDPALFDNGNGYRIILGSLGLKAAANNNTVLIAPARTYDTMTNTPIGGVYFSFNKYQIMVEQQPVLSAGVDPALNAPPQSFDRNQEFSIAPYNVENLYDRRDDPFDGCDFTGNSGCPGVSPPFDYVPASQAIYEAHLNDIAQQIINDLHGPDIIFVQEAEDQDICTVTSGTMACDLTTNNTKFDGKPDTLQELAVVIAGLGGPAYDAVYDRNGADDRGIVSAFLYRTDRVELLPASASDPVLGNSPTVSYRGAALPYNTDVQNPKALNADLPSDVDLSTGVDGSNVFTRPPQVGLFRIWQDAIGSGTSLDLYALSNHFSSTPDARVGQRTEQALYDASIVAALQAPNPDVLVAVAGDFNVYPRPDDPFPSAPSDQLGPLYVQGLLNLFDVLVAQVPASAYSYIFQGQTQTLDQIFVTPSLMSELVQARAAHLNSDWPADYDGDGPRGASDHDPLVARFCRDVTAPSVSASPDVLWPPNHKYVDVSVTVSDDADPNPTATLLSVTSNEPDNDPGPEDGNTINDIVTVDDFHFQLRAERSDIGTGRVYTITYMVTDACVNSATATTTVTVPLLLGD